MASKNYHLVAFIAISTLMFQANHCITPSAEFTKKPTQLITEYSNAADIFKKLDNNKRVTRHTNVQTFHQQQPIPHTTPSKTFTPLMRAAQRGDINQVNKLIAHTKPTININATDSDGNTALRWAMNAPENRIYPIATALLNAGAHVDSYDTTKHRTPLHWLLRRHPNAFEKKLPTFKNKKTLHTIAMLLLKRGANPLITDQHADSKPRNCLYWALFNNDFELFDILIANIKHTVVNDISLHNELVEALFKSLQIDTYDALINALIKLHKRLGTLPDLCQTNIFLQRSYHLTQKEITILINDAKQKIQQRTSVKKTTHLYNDIAYA
jgi:ankyrin repeat protein